MGNLSVSIFGSGELFSHLSTPNIEIALADNSGFGKFMTENVAMYTQANYKQHLFKKKTELFIT